MRIGLRAHDYGQNLSPYELAEVLAPFKLALQKLPTQMPIRMPIQLAIGKAVPNLPPGGITSGYARTVRNALAEKGIEIAVLGCYINPVEPDKNEREKQLRRFEEHLRYARDFDCSIVGTETGSSNSDCFNIFCDSLGRLINCAEKCGSIVAIEAVAEKDTISTIERMKKVLDIFPSPALKVIYDPVNILPVNCLFVDGKQTETQANFFKRAFDTFGERIAVIHAKDYKMIDGRKGHPLPAGEGELDYKSLLSILNEHKPDIDILLENSVPARLKETIKIYS